MKFKMSSLEASCIEANTRFLKTPHFLEVGREQYYCGYHQAKKDLIEHYKNHASVRKAIQDLGKETVELNVSIKK